MKTLKITLLDKVAIIMHNMVSKSYGYFHDVLDWALEYI